MSKQTKRTFRVALTDQVCPKLGSGERYRRRVVASLKVAGATREEVLAATSDALLNTYIPLTRGVSSA
jgi:hypothetical protein